MITFLNPLNTEAQPAPNNANGILKNEKITSAILLILGDHSKYH